VIFKNGEIDLIRLGSHENSDNDLGFPLIDK